MEVPIQQKPKEPPTRVPKKASRFAARLWAKSVVERVQLLIDPSPETARTFFQAGLESFDINDLRFYIETDQDVIPLLREWMQLDHDLVRPWAQTVLRIWWPVLFDTAMNPARILADITADDPEKGALLSTPKGRVWFDSTIFLLISYFRWYAQIVGDGQILPPANMPDKLKTKALTGAVRLMKKIQGRGG